MSEERQQGPLQGVGIDDEQTKRVERTETYPFVVSQLVAMLSYARERDYVGWDLYDAESSQLLQALPVDWRWLNPSFQQLVRQAPVNIRPFLLVQQRRSFMRAALFARANFTAHELTGDTEFLDDGLTIYDWLVPQNWDGYTGYCGGHNDSFQGLSHRSPPPEADVVSTPQAVKALLAASEHGEPQHGDIARSAADFLVSELEYERVMTGARIKYRPNESGTTYTLHANALGARLFVDLYATFGDERYCGRAERILDYNAPHQTPVGGWHYRETPSSSHPSMDNFHNRFIIESLLRYGEICDDDRYADTVTGAASFYRDLFDDNGAPHWGEKTVYPRDVHACAQGIIVFSLLGEPRTARRILKWTVSNLSDGEGQFYHEKRRFYTKRVTLMRRCQAWMAYALATYLRRTSEVDAEHIPQGADC